MKRTNTRLILTTWDRVEMGDVIWEDGELYRLTEQSTDQAARDSGLVKWYGIEETKGNWFAFDEQASFVNKPSVRVAVAIAD